MKPNKIKKLLDEASYYTGNQGGQQSPETRSPYEFAKDSVPSLDKIGELKNQGNDYGIPKELPFPLQDATRELAEIYLKAQDLRNKAKEGNSLPIFKGKEAELKEFRNKLNGIMVECKKLAATLSVFSLAPRS